MGKVKHFADLPGAPYVAGSPMSPMCKSRYPVNLVAVDVKSACTIVDQAYSVPKRVRLAGMSAKSYDLLCKMFAAVTYVTRDKLEPKHGSERSWDMLVGTFEILKDKSRKINSNGLQCKRQ